MKRTGQAWLTILLALAATSTASAHAQAGSAAAPAGSAPRLLTDPSVLFGPDRYPRDAQRAEQQGRVVVQITVTVDGGVSACQVTLSSGSAALDAGTCASWYIARFEPAHDAQGRAVQAFVTKAIRWTLPS